MLRDKRWPLHHVLSQNLCPEKNWMSRNHRFPLSLDKKCCGLQFLLHVWFRRLRSPPISSSRVPHPMVNCFLSFIHWFSYEPFLNLAKFCSKKGKVGVRMALSYGDKTGQLSPESKGNLDDKTGVSVLLHLGRFVLHIMHWLHPGSIFKGR